MQVGPFVHGFSSWGSWRHHRDHRRQPAASHQQPLPKQQTYTVLHNQWSQESENELDDDNDILSTLPRRKNPVVLSQQRRQQQQQQQQQICSRRDALWGFAAASALTIASTTQKTTMVAWAGVPEMDEAGNLYTPKNQMLTGGSLAARGIPITERPKPPPDRGLQSIYETRFVAYLSRFLLNFDPAARAWWVQQGLGDSWEFFNNNNNKESSVSPGTDDNSILQTGENAFAEFAYSVEVGLADYFSGPFGSYSSVSAMVAGLGAVKPATSRKAELQKQKNAAHSFLDDIFGSFRPKEKQSKVVDNVAMAKQGILNLYSLLKARYNTVSAKRQLAILFSFVSSPYLQPVNEISSLLGEADNATITQVRLVQPAGRVFDELDSRTSPRRGGGYSVEDLPKVTVEEPPPLGDQYRNAEIIPILQPTSRILKIEVVDGGEGYTNPPTVTVVHRGIVARQCQAAAILDREGRVESIWVLDPGYGYGTRNGVPPTVQISAPQRSTRESKKQSRRAKALALLEYGIVELQILKGGNGFVRTEPPTITITPPREDPDWYINVQESPAMRMVPVADLERVRGEVTEMKLSDGNIAYSVKGVPDRSSVINDDLFQRLQRDPIELLPSSTRPDLVRDPVTGKDIYSILQLASIPQFVAVMSPRYRACDPVFGGVGRLPVLKTALKLTTDEYARLALSGAVCTVLVRTALNPLELVKTKQQLQNDEQLMEYTRLQMTGKQDNDSVTKPPSQKSVDSSKGIDVEAYSSPIPISYGTASALIKETGTTQIAVLPEKRVQIGTVDLIRGIARLRGPLALFQSTDITFLTSLVFGSFGFGATELFRRSFTAYFTEDSSGGSEWVLLLAAAAATVLTAAVASPFEVLRVRSMGLIEPKKWTLVLEDFLEEKSPGTRKRSEQTNSSDFDWKSLMPLWSGFAPILSRELPFALAKFVTFDFFANLAVGFINTQASEGSLPVQIGVGPVGLTISAAAGAVAGIAGAFVSHPADLILTRTSASKRNTEKVSGDESAFPDEPSSDGPVWLAVVRDLVSQEGGLGNLFVGLGSRSIFFFLVIGLQFFLYDYVKNFFEVGSDDLSLVLDVFYAVRAGLVEMNPL
jgi:solute carrier family 25 phosphate transporter 3